MAKITQPIKEFWESDKKPDYLKSSNMKDGAIKIVKFVRPKSKKSKLLSVKEQNE